MSYQSELSKLGIDTKGQFSGLIKTKCPKCSSTRKKTNDPCLSVNIDTGLYKCHNCQWSGSASARQYNVPEPRKEGPDGRIQAYFSGRGILPLTVESFRITMAVETMPQDGKKHVTVCFNYYDDMSLVNIKFKTSTKLFKMVTGAKKIAYNLNSIKESDYVIICEGEEETMVWHQSGYPHVVSCPGGANVNTNNLEWLDNSYQYFENKKIILATDSDAPGRKLRDDLARRFEHSDVYVVSFPDDCKDANDVLKLYGSECLGNLFKEAKLLPIKELSEAMDYRDLILTYRSDGYPKGATVAMNDTDKLLSWNRGELVVVSGIPGVGKSSLIDYYYIRLAVIENWKFGIFSPENAVPLKITRMIEQLMGDSIKELNEEQIKYALSFINEHFYFYNIEEMENFKIEHILTLAKGMIRRYGITCLCLDPFNYLELEGSKENTHENIGELLRNLKKFCLKYDINVTLIAHPRKMDKLGAEYKVPTLYDIAQSSHFFNSSDVGMVVHRRFQGEPGEQNITLHVQKMKYHFRGQLGNVDYYFDKKTGRYSENGNYDNLSDVLLNQFSLL